MYIVNFINEYGQSYTRYGLLESFRTDDDFKVYEFDNLDKARKYTKAFIRRYPQVTAQIFNCDTLIDTVQDDEYCHFKNKKTIEWKDTQAKAKKVSSYISHSLFLIASLLFTLIIHYMGEYGLSIYAKLILTPLCMLIFWQLSNRVLAGLF